MEDAAAAAAPPASSSSSDAPVQVAPATTSNEDASTPPRAASAQVRFGTMGWTEPTTVAALYASHRSEPLVAYSRLFSAVEVNSSHHALPRADNVKRWAESTPRGFVFHFKLFRGLVPRSSMESEEGEAEDAQRGEWWAAMARGIEPARAAGKLGFVVVQLPLGFAPSPAGERRVRGVASRLRGFGGLRTAFEFRDRRWLEPDAAWERTCALMRELDAALVAVDELEHELHGKEDPGPAGFRRMPFRLACTASTGERYVRVHRRAGGEDKAIGADAALDIARACAAGGGGTAWVMMGTDFKDVSLRNCRAVEAALPLEARFPWPPAGAKRATIAEFFGGKASSAAHAGASATAGDAQRVIAVLDMDAFYAAVERRKDPSLCAVPLAVAMYTGTSLIAVSYEAKRAGVRRNHTIADAQRACPGLRVVRVKEKHGKADLGDYRGVSEEVMRVITRHVRVVERASIDEVYMDLTSEARRELSVGSVGQAEQWNVLRRWGETPAPSDDADASVPPLLAAGARILERIRAEIRAELAPVTASAGVAPNRFLAKMACGTLKPDGLAVVPPGCARAVMRTMPLREAIGLRGKMGAALADAYVADGCVCVGDLADKVGEARLCRDWGDKDGKRLFQLATGRDDELVELRTRAKSIGCSKTFPGPKALTTKEEAFKWIGELALEICERWEADGERRPTNLTLSVWGRGSRTAAAPTDVSSESLAAGGRALFARLFEAGSGVHIEGMGLALVGLEEDAGDAAAASSGGAAGAAAAASAWTCPTCTFENSGEWLRCEVCRGEKHAVGVASEVPATVPPKVSKGPTNRWTCAACTYADNDARFFRCDGCGVSRVSSSSSTSPSGARPDKPADNKRPKTTLDAFVKRGR